MTEKVPVIIGAPSGSSARVVNLALSHLHDLLLALALVVLLRVLTLGRLLISGKSPGEVQKTSANEATVVAICTVELLIIWPWPKLLLLIIWPWPKLLLLIIWP